MNDIEEIELILKILKAIGCKLSISERGIDFSDKNLIPDILLNKIHIHEEKIKETITGDISLMSLGAGSGGVGTEMKKILSNISEKYLQFDRYDELDARGYEWCESNKSTIIRWLRNFALSNELGFARKSANTIIRKAISDYKKKLLLTS